MAFKYAYNEKNHQNCICLDDLPVHEVTRVASSNLLTGSAYGTPKNSVTSGAYGETIPFNEPPGVVTTRLPRAQHMIPAVNSKVKFISINFQNNQTTVFFPHTLLDDPRISMYQIHTLFVLMNESCFGLANFVWSIARP